MPQTPVFRAAGAWSFTGNNVSTPFTAAPGAPAGKAVGDTLFLVCESRSITATVATPTGWTLVTGFPVRSTTASGGSIYLFRRVADGTATDTPSPVWTGLTTGTTGDASGAGILCYIGDAVTATIDGTPVVSDLAAQVGSSVVTGLTTALPGTLVLSIAMKIIDFSGANSSTWTERADVLTTSGTGHGLEIADTTVVTAGASGNSTVTWGLATSARVLGVTVGFAANTVMTDAATVGSTTTVGYSFTASFSNNAEGGTNNVTPTSTDTGSGNSFNTIIVDPGASLIYSNTIPAHGVLSYRLATRAQGSCGLFVGTVGITRNYGRAYFYASALTGDAPIISFYPATTFTGARLAHIAISSAGKLVLLNGVGTFGAAAVWTSTSTLSPGVQYRVEFSVTPNGTTSTIQVKLFVGDSTTSIEDSGVQTVPTDGSSYTTANSLTFGVGSNWGYANWPDPAGFMYYDDMVAFASTWPGPILEFYTPAAVGTAYTESATIESDTDVSGSTESLEHTDLGTPATVTDFSGSSEVYTGGVRQTDKYRTQLSVGGAPVTSSPQTLYIQARKANPTDSGILRVWLYQGAGPTNLIETYDIILTDTFTIDSHDIANYAAITDWSDIEVTIKGFSDAGFGLTPQVSYIDFDVPASAGIAYTDLGTVPGATSVSSSDIYTPGTFIYTDAATASSVTNPSTVEVHEIPDSGLVSSKTTPSTTDVAAYTETATISGVTSVSTTETTQDVDANTGTTTTTVTSSDIATLVDSASLGTTTVVTTTDLAAYVDAATAASTTQPSTVDLHEIPDSGTVTCKTTPTSADVAAYVDANTTSATTTVIGSEGGFAETNTLATITSLSSIDVAAYVDGVIVAGVSSVTSADLPVYTEVGTPTSVTSITTVDVAAFVDGTIVSGNTTATGNETVSGAATDANTLVSTTTPSAIEVAAYVDAQTVASKTSLSFVEVAPSDAATISGVTNVSTTEIAAFVDSGTIAATTTPSGVDLLPLSDLATISGTTTFSGLDLAAFTDSGTIVSNSIGTAGEVGAYTDFALAGGITSLISDEQLLHGNQEASTISIVTSLGSVEVAAYVDAATSQTTTTPSSVELRVISDAATIATSSVLSSVETAQFVDAATNTSVTIPSATEIREISDAGTVSSTTTLTSVEVVPGTDASTVTSVTSLAAIVEVHEIPDVNTVVGITTPSSVEVVVVVEQASVGSTTTISSTDLAAYVDTSVVSSVTTPSGVEGTISGKSDADTVVDTTTPSAAEVAAYVEQATISGKTGVTSLEGGFADSNTIPTSTSLTPSEIAAFLDSRIVSGTTSLSAIEQETDQDTSIINSASTLIYSDIAAYLESATIVGGTTFTGIEFPSKIYTDTNTIPTQTGISYVEQAIYVETSTLVTRTSLTDFQITVYTDASTITSFTLASSVEVVKSPTFDFATITSRTSLTPLVEFIGRLSDVIVVTSYFRWNASITYSRWYAPVQGFLRWGGKPLNGRLATKVTGKWAAWKP